MGYMMHVSEFLLWILVVVFAWGSFVYHGDVPA